MKNMVRVVSKFDACTDDLSIGVINVSNYAHTDLGRYLNPAQVFPHEVWGMKFKSVGSVIAWLKWGECCPSLATERLTYIDELALQRQFGEGRKINFTALATYVAWVTGKKMERVDKATLPKFIDFFYKNKKGFVRPSLFSPYTKGIVYGLNGWADNNPPKLELMFLHDNKVEEHEKSLLQTV